MARKFDIVVIGGGPAGVISAVTSRLSNPDKSIALIRKDEKVLVPCGIPYIIHQLGGNVDSDILPDAPLENAKVEKIIDEVVKLDRGNKVLETKGGDQISYEKLILATGSLPRVPKIEGAELEGVFTVAKSYDGMKKFVAHLEKSNSVVVVGAGFIGMEVADEMARSGKKVYIVEVMPWVLPGAFDSDFAEVAAGELKKLGAEVITGKKIARIKGNGKVSAVELDDGTEIKADMVVLSTGYSPNTKLAEDSGLELNTRKMIVVDEYMRTSDSDIFAVGDCAAKTCFFTRKASNIMLASTAVAEARIAGMNLYSLEVLKTFSGTIAVFSTQVGDFSFASAGLNEQILKGENIDYVVGSFETVDRHPGKIPGASKVKVKLIAGSNTGVLLGAQVYGGNSIGEMINMIGLGIQNRMRVDEIYTMQIGTHPKLTSAPTVYPVIKAAESALRKMG